MPWKESSVSDERMRFMIRLKDGESMASLCREFGISRCCPMSGMSGNSEVPRNALSLTFQLTGRG